MRYVGSIIADSRIKCGEEDYSTTNGIPQSVPLLAANDAQKQCQSLIYGKMPEIFDARVVIDGVGNQVVYDLPSDIYVVSSVEMLEYSKDKSLNNYYTLEHRGYREFSNESSGEPARFTLQGKHFLVDPYLSTSVGSFRLPYAKRVDGLDIRRGLLEGRSTTGGYYDYIQIANDILLDEAAIGANDYVCVVDPNGRIIYRNMLKGSYSSATRRISFSANTVPINGGVQVATLVSSDIADPVTNTINVIQGHDIQINDTVAFYDDTSADWVFRLVVSRAATSFTFSGVAITYHSGTDMGVYLGAWLGPVSHYIVCGTDLTTHSQLDNICEPYLMASMNEQFYQIQSNADLDEERKNKITAWNSIANAFSQQPRDKRKIPYIGKFENV